MSADATRTLRGVLESTLTSDRPASVSAALGAIENGSVTVAQLYRLLGDLMTLIGSRWQSGEACVWQEHLASATAHTIVEALFPTVQRLAGAARPHGTVVLACPENEEHDLGLRMLSDRFELAGWKTIYLGADTPAGEVALAARESSADLVVLSVSTHLQRARLRETLSTIGPAVRDVRVAVGGPTHAHDRTHALDAPLFDPDEYFGHRAERDADPDPED
jgi:MerR family transcriptional regulator, light-induced transcriptional regulator